VVFKQNLEIVFGFRLRIETTQFGATLEASFLGSLSVDAISKK
jgi:hypothetical protein